MLKRTIVVLMLCSPALFFFSKNMYGEEDAPTLATHMKAINQNLRELRRQLPDTAKKTENLRLLAGIRDHVLAAQREQPPKTADLPVSERASFLRAYRSTLDRVVGTLDELKATIAAGNLDTAQQLIQKLNDLKGEGHSKFQQE